MNYDIRHLSEGALDGIHRVLSYTYEIGTESVSLSEGYSETYACML